MCQPFLAAVGTFFAMRMPHCSHVSWWIFLDSSGSGDGGSLGGLANFKMPRQAASKQRNIDEFVSVVYESS